MGCGRELEVPGLVPLPPFSRQTGQDLKQNFTFSKTKAVFSHLQGAFYSVAFQGALDCSLSAGPLFVFANSRKGFFWAWDSRQRLDFFFVCTCNYA